MLTYEEKVVPEDCSGVKTKCLWRFYLHLSVQVLFWLILISFGFLDSTNLCTILPIFFCDFMVFELFLLHILQG